MPPRTNTTVAPHPRLDELIAPDRLAVTRTMVIHSMRERGLGLRSAQRRVQALVAAEQLVPVGHEILLVRERMKALAENDRLRAEAGAISLSVRGAAIAGELALHFAGFGPTPERRLMLVRNGRSRVPLPRDESGEPPGYECIGWNVSVITERVDVEHRCRWVPVEGIGDVPFLAPPHAVISVMRHMAHVGGWRNARIVVGRTRGMIDVVEMTEAAFLHGEEIPARRALVAWLEPDGIGRHFHIAARREVDVRPATRLMSQTALPVVPGVIRRGSWNLHLGVIRNDLGNLTD